MIKGGFDNEGRPLILADVNAKEALNPISIRFLIDTGAINTIIMPGDASRFQVDFNSLQNAPPLQIGGGPVACFRIEIFISLIDRGMIYTYITDGRIVDYRHVNVRHPSILGQNVWGRWGLILYPSGVEIDPKKPDLMDPPQVP